MRRGHAQAAAAAVTIAAAALAISADAAARPWEARETSFGPTAVGETLVAPGAPATEWNVLAVGLFCGTAGLNPGRVNLYLYGIAASRLATAEPLRARLVVDGAAVELVLKPVLDVAVTVIPNELARRLSGATEAAVLVEGDHASGPDRLDMTGAAAALKAALRPCLRD